MKNISYGELAVCQEYAERVIRMYRACNHGNPPISASEAELAVREYNNDFTKFKHLYGTSIRGYIQTIVECIGMIVETQ